MIVCQSWLSADLGFGSVHVSVCLQTLSRLNQMQQRAKKSHQSVEFVCVLNNHTDAVNWILIHWTCLRKGS